MLLGSKTHATQTHRIKKKTSQSLFHPQLLSEEVGHGCTLHSHCLVRGLLEPLPMAVDLLHLEHMHVQGSIFRERLCDSVCLSGAMEIALDFSPTPPPTPFG